MSSKNIFIKKKKSSLKMWLSSGFLAAIVVIAFQVMLPQDAYAKDEITVYKSPTCGCCTKWISHLESNGFKVKAIDTKDMNAVKKDAGLHPGLGSCHTGLVNGYTIEGHVPASDIKRLLAEKPNIRGLTVPGMPMGSPGMEGPRKDRYQVLTFDDKGKTTVYSTH